MHGWDDEAQEDPSLGPKHQRRSSGAVAHTILSLEQRAAALASQVQQLELQNKGTRQRHNVLSAICSVTRHGVDVAAGVGSGLAGAVASCNSILQSCSLKAVDMCVGVTLSDHPWAVHAAAAPPVMDLRWPSDSTTPLAPQLADGGSLALLQHCLGLLQQHPAQFAWVQRQTPETARDMLHLIQGVIQNLLSRASATQQDAGQTQPCCGSTTFSSSRNQGSSGTTAFPGPAAIPGHAGCSSSTTSSTQASPLQLGNQPAPVIDAAAAAGGVAAAAVGGGRALGATLAFLEVAAVVHDALLEQQQQVGQQQQQQQQQGSGIAASDQLVHCWAQAVVAAAKAGRAPAAAQQQGAGQLAALCDIECALLGVVAGFIACLVMLHLSDVQFVMGLGRTTCTPFPDPLVPYATEATRPTPGQMRDVLWTCAFYSDLRRPTWEAQCELVAQMTALMGRDASTGAAAMGGVSGGGSSTPPPAPAGAPAPPAQQQHGVEEGLGMASPDHQLLLQEASQRLAMYERVHMWYEAMQFNHTFGLMSLRQVAAFMVAVAPVTTSPVCWSMRLLRQLLDGSPWVAALAEEHNDSSTRVPSALRQQRKAVRQEHGSSVFLGAHTLGACPCQPPGPRQQRPGDAAGAAGAAGAAAAATGA